MHDSPRRSLVSLQRIESVTLLRIDNPPVNAISPGVVDDLARAFEEFERDHEATALVIACAGRTFVAGGDIGSFDSPGFSARPYNHLLARLEASRRPVVAALHGTVLGGGLELALACHWRLASAGTKFGFPEVKLGLLPGSLGTQRLPRLIGIRPALDLISTGRNIDASDALALGVIDAVVDAGIEAEALRHARSVTGPVPTARRLSTRSVSGDGAEVQALQAALDASQTSRYPTAGAIARAVQASLQPFAAGEAEEARLFEVLRASAESKALRHLFFAQREAGKVPGLAQQSDSRSIGRVGVLGGGTMGRGIAMNFLNAGMPTRLIDTSAEALTRATAAIRALYEASAAKGKLQASEVERRMALLEPNVDDSSLADCDLVIEAVFEDMALKKQVCERLGRVCKPGAIIATNTSTLDVDEIATASGRPQDVVGMHFFSPANVMRLLEIVRGRRTSPEVLSTAMQVARRIGKVAVVSGVCWGFIGNRMLEPYLREAEFLILEGATPQQVDRAIERFGMAMGPCRMIDLAGVDVGAKVLYERAKAGGLPPDPAYRVLVRRLFEAVRLGQKNGTGYYRYEGRQAVPDPAVDRLAAALASEFGIERRAEIPEQEIVERLLYPLINEGARILEEGIACRGSDLDVVWSSGYGFPDFKGGPAFFADSIGLNEVVSRLEYYARQCGDRHGYWTASPLLQSLSAKGGRLSEARSPA